MKKHNQEQQEPNPYKIAFVIMTIIFIMAFGCYFVISIMITPLQMERDYYKEQFSNVCQMSNLLVELNNEHYTSCGNSQRLPKLNCEALILR